MTLVIAHRLGNKVSFSSDSRLSFGSEGYFDHCIKIFKVRCRMRGPARNVDDFNNWEFENDYGLAVIGSSINAYTVKDSISELIANLQYMDGHSDISVAGVAQLAFKVYATVTDELTNVLRERGICEILIAGHCLVRKRTRVFHFSTTVYQGGLIYNLSEILTTDAILFFGSAAKSAERINAEFTDLTPLEIVKKTVAESGDMTIGGDLQHGYIDGTHFKVTGVWETIQNSDGTPKMKQTLRGFTLGPLESMMIPPYLYVSYQFTPVKPPPTKNNNPELK